MPSLLKQVSRGADLYFTFRFLRLLTMDWKKTDAYKYKIIDAKGKVLKKSSELETVNEKAGYTMFHRLVFKMRRLIEKVPVIGKSILLNYAAALFLLKEKNNTRIWTDEKFMERELDKFLESDWEEEAAQLKENFRGQYGLTQTNEFLIERKMTDAEIDKREKIVLSLKKKEDQFKAKYGSEWKNVMYATATKMAMGEEIGIPSIEEITEETMKTFEEYQEIELDEGTALQVKMALSDVGLKGTWKNNKVYVKKSDVKKAEKALKGNVIYRGKPPVVVGEEVEIEEGGIGAIPLKQLKKQYDKNEDENRHTENYLMLARAYGTPAEVKKVEQILKRNEKQGSTSSKDNDWMYKNINPYYKKMMSMKEEVEIDEVGQSRPRAGGPISIQRNIKKHIELMNKYIKQGMSKDEASKKAYKEIVKEEVELDEGAKFSASQIKALKTEYSKIQKIDPESPSYKKMKVMLGNMSKEQLKQIKDAKIKFLQFTAGDLLRKMGEEAPTMSAGSGAIAGLGVGSQGEPGVHPRKKKKKRIEESVKMSTFAGKDVFIVDSDMYHACRLGKKKYHRYEKYVGTQNLGMAIREYGLKHPKRPIILQNGEDGPMLYLRYGRS